eukprot:TRINITY_DN28838_c0_g1_i1.p1 TRINITY_DN28838_c0_g1~~TRINITY_DN28838_c0_g1_i1.p1  ORF type:complete len:409 (+),score=83.29 TRINITY_DN28838_c0_g1_i1:148-1374(+)
MPCFYAALGIDRSASENEIRSAYRRRALATHPDKGGCAEDFRVVVAALETLIDASRRAAYDRKQCHNSQSVRAAVRREGPHSKRHREGTWHGQHQLPQKCRAGKQENVAFAGRADSSAELEGKQPSRTMQEDDIALLFQDILDLPKHAAIARLKTLTEDALRRLAKFLNASSLEQVEDPCTMQAMSGSEVHADAGSDSGTSVSECSDERMPALRDILGFGETEGVGDYQLPAECVAADVGEKAPRIGMCAEPQPTLRGIHRNQNKGKYFGYHAYVGFAGMMVFTQSSTSLETVIDMHISLVRMRQLVRERLESGQDFRQALFQAVAAVAEERTLAQVPLLRLRFRCRSPTSGRGKVSHDLDAVVAAHLALSQKNGASKSNLNGHEQEAARQRKKEKDMLVQNRGSSVG